MNSNLLGSFQMSSFFAGVWQYFLPQVEVEFLALCPTQESSHVHFEGTDTYCGK